MEKQVLLVGAGPMSVAYAKVLQSMGTPFVAVGRGSVSAAAFEAATGVAVYQGGIESYLKSSKTPIGSVIVAVGERWLGAVTRQLINSGYTSILVEKPGAFNYEEIEAVKSDAIRHSASVFVGYNRRFHSSTQKALEIIRDDGGIVSFNFEFTEWSHKIADLYKEEGVKEQWFLHNSTHVVDLAFYLGGLPKELSCFVAGSLAWHPLAARFSGAGISQAGALFSYHATWDAPGRWGVEVLTKKNRLIFRPLEELKCQQLGSVAIEPVLIDNTLDVTFKPGIFLQTRSFLEGETEQLCTIAQQCEHLNTYKKMCGLK